MAAIVLLTGCALIVVSGAIAMHNPAPVHYETAMTLPATSEPAGEGAVADAELPLDDQSIQVKKLYVLPADKVIVRVMAPVEVRDELYQELSPAQAKRMHRTPGAMLVRWDNGELKNYGMTWGSGYSVQMLLQMLLQVPSQQVETVGNIPMFGGDILFKMGAKPEEYMKGLEQIFREELKQPCSIGYRDVQRHVIVLQGKWKFTAADPAASKADPLPTIQMFGIKLDKNRENGGTAEGSSQNFARWVGGWINKEVVVEAEGMPEQIRIHYNYDELQNAETREKSREPARVLGHIQEQTGLKWSEETRMVRRIVIERLP